jgi:HPt (histidine-containing phosphotransfer) domain-containing protein
MSLQDVLDGLRRDYLNAIPEKIERIRELSCSSNFDELHTEFHKMKGTGRTYGLPEVSQVGEALERLCEQKAAPHVSSHRSSNSPGKGPGSDSDNDVDLDLAINLAIALLDRIRVSRQSGHQYDLENDPNFRTLVALLSIP